MMAHFQVTISDEDDTDGVLVQDTHDRERVDKLLVALLDSASEAHFTVSVKVGPAVVPPVPPATPPAQPPAAPVSERPISDATQTAPQTQRGTRRPQSHFPEGSQS